MKKITITLTPVEALVAIGALKMYSQKRKNIMDQAVSNDLIEKINDAAAEEEE